MRNRNRVVVTGMGVLAPNGTGLKAFWRSLVAGESGIGPITLFDATGFKSRIAGEVKNFNPLDYIEPELRPRRLARTTQLAVAATWEALTDAGLDLATIRDDAAPPLPVILGVATSAMDILQGAFDALRDGGPGLIKPSALASMVPHAAASFIAKMLSVPTRAATIASTCGAGLEAVAAAASLIRGGESDLALAGGADAVIAPLGMGMLTKAGLSSMRNGEPARASRPFDCERDSGVISEGAGVFVLENLDHALGRGAEPYFEITGYGGCSDSDPELPGCGFKEAMSAALANANHQPSAIDYISAHGAGHPTFDAIELSMIKRVFGKHAYSIPISSIKGVTGNPMAAAGPMQLISSALSLRHNVIPPTANCEHLDSDCDLDIVRGRPRRAKLNSILLNARGLGGSASTMIVNRIGS